MMEDYGTPTIWAKNAGSTVGFGYIPTFPTVFRILYDQNKLCIFRNFR